MILPFTIYPKGGALMFCEDVSEFDENLPRPEEGAAQAPDPVIRPPLAKEDPAPVIEKKITVISNTGAFDVDPVSKLSSRLAPVYTDHIKPLIEMSFAYESPEDGMSKLSALKNAAYEAAMAVRACVVKYSGVSQLVDNYDIIGDILAPCNKMAILNREVIDKAGLGSFTASFDNLECLSYMGQVANIVATIVGFSDAQRSVVGSGYMVRMNDTTQEFSKTFGGFREFLEILFEHPEKMSELCKNETEHIELSDVFRVKTVDAPDEEDCPLSKMHRKMNGQVLKYISATLRTVSVRAYDTQTDIAEGRMTPELFADRIAPNANRVINMFAVGAVLCLHYAYTIKHGVARIQSAVAYRDRLLALKASPETTV